MQTTVGGNEQVGPKEKFSPRSEFMELIEYDPQARTMDIHFRSGSVKRYLFCFPTTFQTFKESPTHDAYFSKVIRGKLTSVSIRNANVGREKAHPLKAVTKRRTLDHGIKKWQPGTVARAGL